MDLLGAPPPSPRASPSELVPASAGRSGPDGGQAAVVAGAAALGLVLLEVIRVWLPSLVVILGEGSGVSPLGLGGVTLATLAIAPLCAVTLGRVPARILWILGAAVLLGARLTLIGSLGGSAQVWAATVGVAGGAVAVVGLAAGAPRGDTARAGFLAGAVGSFALLAALGSVDLAWRTGAFARSGSLLLVVWCGLLIARATRALDGGTAAAWPWAAVGPALVLLGVLGGPAGRIATATGGTPSRAAATAAALQVLLVIGAVIAVRVGPLAAGPAGAALALAGTALALPADASTAVAGQAALLLGIGAVLGAGPRGGDTSLRRRGVVVGASLVGFGVLTLLAYAGYRVSLPIDDRAVLLTAAALVAASGVVGAVRAARLGREPLDGPLLRRMLAAAVVIGVLLASGGLLRPGADGPGSATEGELRVSLANVHSGFDTDGRLRAIEVGRVLADLDADIIVLNEVDRGWLISGSPDLLGSYLSATGMTGVFGPAADEVRGNAVLTRLPVLEVQRTVLPRGRDPLTRTVLTVVVELPDGTALAVVATQLSDVDRQGDTRLPQAQAVAAVVARLQERGVAVIVAGDLNATLGDAALVVLEELLVRTLPDSARTFPAAAPRDQLDHVLVPADWQVRSSRAFNSGFSDHRFVETVLVPAVPAAPGAATAPAGSGS
jgi:endonuclease/exonuclease/phosphatase family metal-dependent hydrolase